MSDMQPHVPSPARAPGFAGVVVLVGIASFIGGLFIAQLGGQLFKLVSNEAGDEQAVVNEADLGEDEENDISEDSSEPALTVSTERELVVDWIEPFKQPHVTVDPVLASALCPGWDEQKEWPLCGNPLQLSQVRLGTIVGGAYDGMYLELATARTEELGFSHRMLYVLIDPLKQKNSVILDLEGRSTGESFPSLNTYTATEILGWNNVDILEDLPGYTVDITAQIPDLIADESIEDTEGNRFFLSGGWVRFDSSIATSVLASENVIRLEGGQELIEYEAGEGASTQVGKNQYFLIDEDGRVLWYDLEVVFFDYAMRDEMPILSQGIPSIIWNDGSQNTQTYMKGALGGCGFTTLTNVVSQEIVDGLRLTKAGVGTYDANATISIYEPESYKIEYFADAFNLTTWSSPDEEPLSYDAYEHAYIYFQDALGRWVELMNYELLPPVECGKPVIYLYPEETTDMRVWVSPRGGFSYTEPAYGDGWEVTAYTDGQIVNKEDGVTYPYLFWEGRGGLYPQVESYWVVEQEGVEAFLVSALSSMNFNPSEIEDFLEFWLPRMESDSFYKIGFHGTAVMNELAPLSLSVRPDHVFRVLMDYEGLDAWEPSDPPSYLPRANRDGFEVMEWGGVLR